MKKVFRILVLGGLFCLGAFYAAAAEEKAAAPPADSPNKIPYISSYYVKPKVLVSEKAVFSYYVTDFYQKEYMLDEKTETFTIDYWVNGEKKSVKNVPAGDNSIELGLMPKGKIMFAVQATDKQGRKSHRLYYEFLVLDPAEQEIPKDKILSPDLAKFKIANNDTNPVETTAGLTAMLKWASENGYRKVILPKGRYRIDENSSVQMATKLTLDMNGSTFKLNPNAKDGCLMLEFIDCYDSHVVNGIFEGDIKEHDYANSKNNSEWVNCMSISQGSEYCSVENVTIMDVTGYGTCTNHRHSYGKSQGLKDFQPGDINEKGEEMPSEIRMTNKNMASVKDFINTFGFIQVGIYLGYQGNPAGNWVYKAHFYDAEKKYIETIEGYLYRKMYPPKNAEFARITLLSTAKPENLCIYNFRAPVNSAYINIKHENIRCVGMALCGFENFLVEGCTFENCGQKSAKCAFDAEDGWDMMHDLTFRNNVFGKNPVNEYLTCAGHNFVMENNTMKTYIWDRTNGYVFRNNKLKSAEFRFGKSVRTGYVRIYNNTFENGASLKSALKDPAKEADRDYCAKNNVCDKGISTVGSNMFFYKCKITGGAITGKAVDCEIKDTVNQGGLFEIYKSRLENCILKSSGSTVSKLIGSTVNKSKCFAQGATIILEGNTLNETDCSIGGDWSDAPAYELRKNVINTSLPFLINVGNSYKHVILQGNTVNSTNKSFVAVHLENPAKSKTQLVDIQDNKFNGDGGTVLKVQRPPGEGCTMTVNMIKNVYNKIEKYNAELTKSPNIKLTEN